MECVPELFPSKGRIGESNGEFIGEKFTHSHTHTHAHGFNRNADLEINHLEAVAQACVCLNKKDSWSSDFLYRSRIQGYGLEDVD